MSRQLIKNHTPQKSSGFTLLEMIVSIGVFALVAVIAVGSLVKITGLNRRTNSLQSAISNINFALEAMTREMRFGSHYTCINGSSINVNSLSSNDECTVDENTNNIKGIAFSSAETKTSGSNTCNLVYAYWFPKNGSQITIKKSMQDNCDTPTLQEVNAVSVIEDPNTTISGFNFQIISGSRGYSLARIKLTGYAGQKDTERNHFDVETMVSQRMAN